MTNYKTMLSSFAILLILSGCNATNDETDFNLESSKETITKESISKNSEVVASEDSLFISMNARAQQVSEEAFIDESIKEIVPELVVSYAPESYEKELLELDALQIEALKSNKQFMSDLKEFYALSQNSAQRGLSGSSLYDIIESLSTQIYDIIYKALFDDTASFDDIYNDVSDAIFGSDESSVSSATTQSSSSLNDTAPVSSSSVANSSTSSVSSVTSTVSSAISSTQSSSSAQSVAAVPTQTKPVAKAFKVDSTYNIQYTALDKIVSKGFDVFDVDLEDTTAKQIANYHEEESKVVCYLSAGSYENWREDKNDFDPIVLGKDMDGWEGEKWLDISNIDVLKPIMAKRMDRAKAMGCDAIHPDNIDGYTNDTGFSLTYADQVVYNEMLATLAHERSLLIGLKNDVDQIDDLVEEYDFAINEECYQYKECGGYKNFIEAGKPVFIIEYKKRYFLGGIIDALDNGYFMILKNRNLDNAVNILTETFN